MWLLPVQHLTSDDQSAVRVLKRRRGVDGVLATRLNSRIDGDLWGWDLGADGRSGAALQRVRLPLRLVPADDPSPDVHVVQAEVGGKKVPVKHFLNRYFNNPFVAYLRVCVIIFNNQYDYPPYPKAISKIEIFLARPSQDVFLLPYIP